MLSLVIPAFNEGQTIDAFYTEVCAVAPKIDAELELCFVDDGSTDATLSKIRALADKDERVHYVALSRNFGKEAALLAGLDFCHGDYVAVMDADLQDPPSLLPQMFERVTDADDPCDCVATRRATRKGEAKLRSALSILFYKIINRFSDTQIMEGARDYRMMTRQMVDAVIADREYNRFSKGIFEWVGFKTEWLSYDNVVRDAGESKWSLWQLFKYALDAVLAYTVAPLYTVSAMGMLLCAVAFVALVVIVVRALVFGDPVSGWPSTMSVMVFLGGFIILALGIIGLYVSKLYLETKRRQIYIVREQR